MAAEAAEEVNEGLEALKGAFGGSGEPKADPPAAPVAPAAEPIDQLESIKMPTADSVPEKFRGQPISKVLKSQREAESAFTTATQRASELAYELQMQRTATTVLKEQLDTFRASSPPKPAAPPQDEWGDLRLDEDVILQPKKVMDRVIAIAREGMRAEIQKAAEEQKQASQANQVESQRYNAAVGAAEQARESLGFDKESWMGVMRDIAPAVFDPETYENGAFNPAAYIHEYNQRKERWSKLAAPPIRLENQGNPPGSKTAASLAPAAPAAVLSPRRTEQAEHFAGIFGIPADRFIARLAAQEGS